ncbi:MAG: peptidase domain-containing ABC transporter [Bacteroidales bacterium]|nr:MAG: peptidase domain-containing ABC transporter [Bacteroidales bacterium]
MKIKQRDITDCGAACLASVAAHYKLNLPIAKIRQMASTDKKGTNVLGMIEAAQKMGFHAKGVKGEWESLFKIPMPTIAHVIVKEVLHHFVVLIKATKDYIEVMDPADGNYHKIPHEDFKKSWTGVLILIAPNDGFQPKSEKVSVSIRFWQLIKPHKGVLVQALIGAVLFSILGLTTSIYVGKIVDYVIPSGNLNLLNLLGVAMLFIILIRVILSTLQSIFVLKVGQRIDATLILGYYQHLLKLPQSFFDSMRVGEIISRINDAVKIRLFINDVTVNLIVNIMILVVSFVLMFTFYWKLAAVMLIVIPLYAITYFILNRLNKKVQRKIMENSAELESHLVESLNAVATIKRFGLEGFSNLKTEVRFVSLLKIIYKSGVNGIFSSASTGLISQVITIVLLWVGAGFVLESTITPGELLSFYSVIGYFTSPVSGIIGFNKTYQDAKIAADRLFEIFDLEIEDESNKIQLKGEHIGDIRFQNVDFRYGTRVEVFKSLNLNIQAGKVTAVVGESGSGKTTLISILQNIYPIQNGNIYLGSYDIRYFTNVSLREKVVVVPQNIDLFAGNIIDNIAVGEFTPDMERIMDICNQLGMTEFIEHLPNRFNTYIGEHGTTLSGGQRQRIAIARALYRNPEILILDEATSSLDSIAEGYVQRTVKLMRAKGKTVIVIAHRLSTVALADHIVVLDNGEVAEQGTFNELTSSKGLFCKMWQHQTLESQFV